MYKGLLKFLLLVSGLLCTSMVAWSAPAQNIASVAANITSTFTQVTKLLTSTGYVGGVMLMVVSIFQFKQYKENPTQVPLSKPMMLLAMGTALIFIPTITDIASATFFGSNGGQSAGPGGTIIGGST